MRWALALAAPLAAWAVWAGVVAPAQRERGRVRAEYARARHERERLRRQVASLDRQAAARGNQPEDASAAARGLRRALLRASDGLRLEELQIAPSAARDTRTAQGRLTASGRLPELLRLADRLAGPDSGVRLDRVTLSERDEATVRIEVEAVGTGTGP